MSRPRLFPGAGLTPEEAVSLSRALCREERILRSRVTPENLLDVAARGGLTLAREGGEIVAAAALWPTADPAALEFGSLWVSPARRGGGLGSRVLDACVRSAPAGARVFLVTKSRKVSSSARHRGWEEVRGWRRNSRWRAALRPVGASAAEARSFNPHSRLFVAPPAQN